MHDIGFLKPGDAISVIAPAGRVKPGLVESGLKWLVKTGFRVVPGRHLFGQYHQFSGTDKQRLGDLQTALDNPEVKAVLCARGGYGTMRIFDKADFSGFANHPKWVAGYSDITTLHCRLAAMGIPSVHSAMVQNFINADGSVSDGLLSLKKILTGEAPQYNIPCSPYNREGDVTAPLVGGNLSIIYSLVGTPFDLDTTGKILFIEDIGEYLYQIERMMISLKLAGKFDLLKGLIVGNFTDIKDNPLPFGKTVGQIIADTVADYTFPVCFGFPAGHDQPNLALAFCRQWRLLVDAGKSVVTMV